MKAEVTQASTAAVHVQGARAAQKTAAAHEGFPSVLGNPQSASPAKADQAAKGKADIHDWRQRAAHRPHAMQAEASAAASAGLGEGLKLDDHLVRLLRKVGADETSQPADDTEASTQDRDDPAASDHTDDVFIPTQLRAEQAISTMMAMNPAGNEAAPSGAAARDDAGADDADAAGREAVETGGKRARPIVEASTGADAAAETSSAKPIALQQQPGRGPAANAAAQPAGNQPVPESGAPAEAAPSASEAASRRKTGPKEPSAKPDGPLRALTEASPKETAGRTAATAASDRADADPDRSGNNRDAAPTAPRERGAEAQPAVAKVTVTAQQSAPAPVPANAVAIASAIGADQARQIAGGAPVQQAAQTLRANQPMRSLKIQLHPAELGVVTAHLKAAGDQLQVELQVENHEAYHRLTSDSDAIVKSLQQLGYDIDRVSIQQPQAATTAAARIETNTDGSSFSRDASAFQSGNSGGGSERSNGQTNGRRHGGDAQGSDQSKPVAQDRAGSGVYI